MSAPKMCVVLSMLLLLLLSVSCEKEHESHGSHKSGPDEEHFHDGEHNPEYDHESILGSRKLDEEFEKLSPEESKKRLAILVKKMDLNQDGNVDQAELEDWVLKSYQALDLEEAGARFPEYDQDNNGKLTWEEYLKKVYGMTVQEMEDLEKANTEDMKDFLEMKVDDYLKFQAANVNNDDHLDVEEFVAFEYPYDFENMHGVEVDRTMKELDKDKDGVVSLEEFVGDREISKEERISEEEQFKEYDTNGDGKLDRKEIRPWVLPDNMSAAKEEARHLIESTDTNKDNVLSSEEIVEQNELWVGSQATDYGKHLQNLKHVEL